MSMERVLLQVKGRRNRSRETAFKDIDVNNYIIDVSIPEDDFTTCKVKSTGPLGNWNTLQFPNEQIGGSCFGTCTCGIPKVKGIPCHHMVAVLKSGLMAGLDKNNIMPTWWMNSQLKLQFPLEVHVGASMDINWLKSRGQPDSNVRNCPSMAAPNKAGRPKKGKRIKGPLEGGKRKKLG